MAKDRKKVIHIHSNVPNKLPNPEVLEVGEIAINNAEGNEFLSFKNSNNENPKVVRFSSDLQLVDWMEKKEVVPIKGIVSANTLNNESTIKISLNQKVGKSTPSATTLNQESGFTFDTSAFALNGGNPTFSSLTVNNLTTLKGKTNISGETRIDKNLTVSGNTNVSGNTTIKGSTNISGNTRIDKNLTVSGNTYISGDTVFGGEVEFKEPVTIELCDSLTSTTIADGICEAFTRGVVTMTKDDNPSDSGLSAVYKFYQNGSQIGYDINVPKDGFLKKCELVESGDTFYLHFIWNVYDAGDKSYGSGETYVNVEDLVKDIDENNSKSDRGVNVNVWYNTTDKKMNVSADTTVTIKNNGGSGTKTFTKNGGTHTLSAYTLSYSHNGFSGKFDPFAASSSFTSPHSSLTVTYEATSGKSGNVDYNTSADKSISIPTCVNHLNRHMVKFQSGSTSSFNSKTYDPGKDCANSAETINIPTKLSHIASAHTHVSSEVNKLSGYSIATTAAEISSADTLNQALGKLQKSINGKQGTLTEGRAIDITNNVISLDLPIYSGTGINSIIEGNAANVASGDSSHAEGWNTQANGDYSHAEGAQTQANGYYSHAEGYVTKASGDSSHAEGWNTKARGNSSHAEGNSTTANGASSHAEGYHTETKNESEHASGQYNVSSSASTEFGDSGNTLFSVGNGRNGSSHNAFEIRQNGDIYIASGSSDIRLQDCLNDTTYPAGTAAQLTAGTNTTNRVWSAKILRDGLNELYQAKGSNYVEGSGLTANNIVLGNGASKIKASTYGVETTVSPTLDTKIPTSKAIATYVTSQMTSVLTYKGTVNKNADLPATHKVGDVYVVASAGTYVGKTCEVGDYIICKKEGTAASNADWDVINGENQVENKGASLAAAGSSATIATVDGTNLTITTPSTWTGVAKTGTVTKITTASGLTGGDITGITTTGTIGLAATGTAGTYGPTANVTGTEGTTIKIPQITTDAYGRVTSVTERTLTNKNSTYTVNNGTFTISGNGTSVASTSANASANSGLNIKSGSNVTITTGTNEITIAATNTKVTSVGNHYTPASSTTKSASASGGGTLAFGGSVISGVTLNVDAAGHVTNVSVSSAKLPSNPNSHYTTRIYAGASGVSGHSATSNPYVKITDDYTYRNQIRLSGAGSINVNSNSAGTVTISGTNTTYSAGTAAQLSAGTNNYNGLWSAVNLKTGLDKLYKYTEGRAIDITNNKISLDLPISAGTGTGSIIENNSSNKASGDYSHAEGSGTTASGDYSHAEGYKTTASGNFGSHAEGRDTTASSQSSHAEGSGTTASGNSSHAEGYGTIANGAYSHAEGRESKSIGQYSHAEGDSTTALGSSSHAEGWSTMASGTHSHSEGRNTTASGYSSHAEGQSTMSSGESSHAEGQSTHAYSQASHSEGYNTLAKELASHAEGSGTTASSVYSHAEGSKTIASGHSAHAEGRESKSVGQYSHAEGYRTSATTSASHAEGSNTVASGDNSHAEGYYAKALGYTSHAEGISTQAIGSYSHAEGDSTKASGESSHAEGSATITSNNYEHASGRYNVSSSASTEFGNSGNTLFSVGNGTAENARHNAFEIRQNGDTYINGVANVINTSDTTRKTAIKNSGTTISYIVDGTGGGTAMTSVDSSKVQVYSREYGQPGENSITLTDSRILFIGNYSASGSVASSNYGQHHILTVTSNSIELRGNVAEGDSTIASGSSSHAEGQGTFSIGDYSHAEGQGTTAKGSSSHAEGYGTIANGAYSHAEGGVTQASGNYTHAEGFYTVTKNQSEHASGQYNVSSSASTTFGNSGNTLFSVGNGIDDSSRHNAFEIRQNGDMYITSGSSDMKLQDHIVTSDDKKRLDMINKTKVGAATGSGGYMSINASNDGLYQHINVSANWNIDSAHISGMNPGQRLILSFSKGASSIDSPKITIKGTNTNTMTKTGGDVQITVPNSGFVMIEAVCLMGPPASGVPPVLYFVEL